MIGTSSNVFGEGVGGLNTDSGTGVYGFSPAGTGVFAQSLSGVALRVDGNVVQTLGGNGFVKAMALITFNGNNPATIVRCYNGITNSSSGNCGFILTNYIDGDIFSHATINFGFQVDNRFISATSVENRHDAKSHICIFPNSNTIDVQSNANFYILVF